MPFSFRFLLLAVAPFLMTFTAAMPEHNEYIAQQQQVISTCAMPTALRSQGLPGNVRAVIYLVQDGARYDLEFVQGPFDTWRLSDGGIISQAGSAQQFLQLSADHNQFLYGLA